MQKLHIAHRDIKPGNLYYYDKRYCIGDFGLVDFLEHVKDLTDAYRNANIYNKDIIRVSAIIYSIAKTAKANNLKPYEYFEYLLTEIPKHMDDTDRSFLNNLVPWSEKLPENIRKPQK